MSTCLGHRGFDFPVADLAVTLEAAQAQERIDLARMWGITDASIARVHGYLPPPTATRGIDVTDIPEQALTDCVARADQVVDRRPQRSAYGAARDLLIKNRWRLERHTELHPVIVEWRACMAESGYVVTWPLHDTGDIAAELKARSATQPSPREIAMALTDISCKEQTEFVPAMNRVAARLEAEIVRRHRSVLTADRERLDAAYRIAVAISRPAEQHQS